MNIIINSVRVFRITRSFADKQMTFSFVGV